MFSHISGPVGCGKTAIVEHLAKMTLRKSSDLIKVQLGDQTDSKMLLGINVCTEIPGKFDWKAGVLTQAVLEGKWLLLEDIDCAPMDVASVLSSLLETGKLSVSGLGDSIKIKSGFQLFVTQRVDGFRRKSASGEASLLEKHWFAVNMEPLSKDELKTVVTTLYQPKFDNVADKLVNVYQLGCEFRWEYFLLTRKEEN